MCLLTYLPAGVMPDTEALHNGAYFNNDGHGYAIAAPDRLIIARGMDSELLVASFASARRRHPEGPALFHSRYSTHGRTSIENCHPFPVGTDTRTVLAHNGVLPPQVWPRDGDCRSDTRITAEDFLPEFGPLRTRRARARLARWMTPDNKMVILTCDRRFKRQSFILNEASGLWDGGIWYSNDGFLPPPSGGWQHDAEDDRGWEVFPWDADTGRPERCGWCRALLGANDDECLYCGWCTGCEERPGHCYCYTPAALDTRRASIARQQQR